MTFKLPVNIPYVNWRDGQRATEEDLDDEQSNKLQSEAAIINNFMGSGIVLEHPGSNYIFNSSTLTAYQQQLVVSNDFDGRGITPHSQPTDTVLGNQLEVSLTYSDVSLRRSVKVCVIGTDFQNNSQYELFILNKNEVIVGKKHFKTVITLLFNDFLGNKNGSRALSGNLFIKETSSIQLSRDEITASQTLEPNLFFRDFKVTDLTVGVNPTTILYETLRIALGTSGYTVDSLDINIGYVDKKSLLKTDISTRYGQKFKAKVNNIQKARVLLGVDKNAAETDSTKWFDWSGDLIVSIHSLQTSVACPTDTIPDNAIDYQLSPTPIVQVIFTQQLLKDSGIVLTDIAQPVDIMFLNSKIGGTTNTGITANNYYAITIQRAGDTSTGDLFTLTGRNYTENSVFTEFNGSTWVDDSTLDLWFEIYSNALKVSSGMGYDAGTGISVDKTILENGSSIDYSKDGIPFVNNGNNVLNHAIVQAISEQITPVQDSRTGNQIYSRIQSSAEISTITSAQLTSLKQSSDPITLGCSYDINNRTTLVESDNQLYLGLADGYTFDIINPSANFLLYNLVGAKFNPNTGNINAKQYLIYKATVCYDGFGDLNNDGEIDTADIARAYVLVGEDINSVSTQNKILAGTITTLEFLRADVDGNGVVTAGDVSTILNVYNKVPGAVFPRGETFTRLRLHLENLYGRNDGYHSSYDEYAQMWDLGLPRQAHYGFDSALPLGSYIVTYYGYPVHVDIAADEPGYSVVPYMLLQFSITLNPYWTPQNIKVNSTGRLLPCSFTSLIESDNPSPVTNPDGCVDVSLVHCDLLEQSQTCYGGRNDLFIPDNLIMGSGQMVTRDGKYFPIDMEICTISLELPPVAINSKAINIFNVFVCESGNSGYTTNGYKAMRFADCSFVQSDALDLNQVKFSIALESLNTSVDGYDSAIGVDAYGAIVDPLVGTNIDEDGVLTIKGTNLYASAGILFNCKIIVTVYLKKAGWKNIPRKINYTQIQNLLGL